MKSQRIADDAADEKRGRSAYNVPDQATAKGKI